jgi:osmotically-inducible protein OsmY
MSEKDEELKKKIIDHLYWDGRVDASDVKVEVDNRKVKLTGTVPNFAASEAALFTIWSIKGIIGVDNKLVVKPVIDGKTPIDADIEKNISQILIWNKSVYGPEIEVSVDAGVVTLEGTVDALWKKMKAEELASHVLGVVKITNLLGVAPSKEIADEVISRDIIEALNRSDNVDVDTIDVKVEEGNVTLSGVVEHWIAYRAAWNCAVNTFGVKDVQNEIIIQ